MRLISLKDGAFAVVESPYVPALVEEFRRLAGQWIDITLADGRVEKGWKFDRLNLEKVKELLRPYKDPELVERVFEFRSKNDAYQTTAPKVDGIDLVGFNRDRFWWRQGNEIARVLSVVSQELRPGGSRNNPRLAGTVTIRVKCRAGAVIGDENWEVKEVQPC